MKKMSLIALMFLFLASCSTMQKFQASDVKEDGIKYNFGADKGIKVGDIVTATRPVGRGVGRGSYSYSQTVGSLTVIRVEKDYSIMKKNGEFEINESITFDRR